MERLTFFENGHWCIRLNGVVYWGFPEVDRLAAYEDAMPLERAQELSQAEKDGRLVAQDIFALFPIDCDVCERNVDGHGCDGINKATENSRPGAEWSFIVKTCPREVCQVRTTPERLQAAQTGTEIDGIRYFLTKQEAEAALEKKEENI